MNKQAFNIYERIAGITLDETRSHEWEMVQSGRYPIYTCELCGADSRDAGLFGVCEEKEK